MASKKTGDWTATSALSLHLRKGGMSLHVGITAAGDRDLWNVLAISAPAKAGTQAVLDNHAHKLIGTFDLGTAIKEAEKYARAWRAADSQCGCGEIAPSAAVIRRSHAARRAADRPT
jgi:hypothetical protein